MPTSPLPSPARKATAPFLPAVQAAWALLLVPLLAAPVVAAAPPPVGPVEELAAFVPDDVGFCLVIRDLRRHGAELSASPFAEAFRRSPLGKALAASREVEHLGKVNRVLEKQVGLGWEGLRDDILGDAVVFAYRPGPPGKPEQDQGLILLRARTATALAALVRQLEQAQKASGELKEVVERSHRGVKYSKRVERRTTNFYLLRGPMLVFSGQEEMLRQAIEREQSGGPRDLSRRRAGVAGRLRELGLGQSFLALWLNPRSFDGAVARAARSDEARAKTFAVCWKALQGIGLGVERGRDLSLSVVVKARTELLPPAARRVLAEAARPGELWRVVPEDALLAVGGRVDAAGLFALLGEFMPPAGRQALENDLGRTLGAVLGKDMVREVLPALGPDWGLWLTPPAPGDKGWAPRSLLALRVARGDATAPVDEALHSALLFWARLAVLGHNRQHPDRPIRLNTVVTDKTEVKYFSGAKAFPPGWQPAFALKGGYLVLASSPEAVRRFAPAPGASSGGPAPLLRVSFKGWRAYLKERREPLAAALAERDRISPGQARLRLDGLRAGLELVDRLEVLQETKAGQVTFTARLQTAQPLGR